MPLIDIPNFDGRTALRAEHLNRMTAEIKRLGKIQGTGGVNVANTANGIVISSSAGDSSFWAKITSVSNTLQQYAWTAETAQAWPGGTSSSFTTFQDQTGTTGTTEANFAKEINGFLFVPQNAYVQMWPGGSGYYLFSYNDYIVQGTVGSSAISQGTTGNVLLTDASGAQQTITAKAVWATYAANATILVQMVPNATTPTWNIISAAPQLIQGSLNSAMSGGSNGTISGCSSLTGGTAPTGNVTVGNPTFLAGIAGDTVLAMATQGGWTALQVTHHNIPIITAHRFNNTVSPPQFEYQSVSAYVQLAAAPTNTWNVEVQTVQCS